MITRNKGSQTLSSVVTHGNTAYLSGIVSANKGDVAEQAKDILVQLDALLAEAGSDRNKLLMANIWLADTADFAAFNEVWLDWIPANALPARATVGACLAGPEYRIEIAAIAAVG